MKLYRITYNDNGIYEELKNMIWKKSDNPKIDWSDFKKSSLTNWLPLPNVFTDKHDKLESYFTEIGYPKFMDTTFSLICKWIDKNKIITNETIIDEHIKNIVYIDEFQVIIKL